MMIVYIKLEKHNYTYEGVTDIRGDSTMLSLDWHKEEHGEEELITSTSGFDSFWIEDIIEFRITENEPQKMSKM